MDDECRTMGKGLKRWPQLRIAICWDCDCPGPIPWWWCRGGDGVGEAEGKIQLSSSDYHSSQRITIGQSAHGPMFPPHCCWDGTLCFTAGNCFRHFETFPIFQFKKSKEHINDIISEKLLNWASQLVKKNISWLSMSEVPGMDGSSQWGKEIRLYWQKLGLIHLYVPAIQTERLRDMSYYLQINK